MTLQRHRRLRGEYDNAPTPNTYPARSQSHHLPMSSRPAVCSDTKPTSLGEEESASAVSTAKATRPAVAEPPMARRVCAAGGRYPSGARTVSTKLDCVNQPDDDWRAAQCLKRLTQPQPSLPDNLSNRKLSAKHHIRGIHPGLSLSLLENNLQGSCH